MRGRRLGFAVKLFVACVLGCGISGCGSGGGSEPQPQQQEARAPASADSALVDAEGLFETHCSVCHSLELPTSQRLDRANWEWVVTDMVSKYGATWITEEQQAIIIDYLVDNYGPSRTGGAFDELRREP